MIKELFLRGPGAKRFVLQSRDLPGAGSVLANHTGIVPEWILAALVKLAAVLARAAGTPGGCGRC
jgi:hypothetical protein